LPEFTRAVRDSIASSSPAINIDFLPLETQVQQSVVRERLLGLLGGGFGLLAAILAAVGLYGLLSYTVESRRNEIGIRMALGANRSAVVNLIVREAGWLLVAGVTAGIAITILASKGAANLLYGLQPSDPSTLASAVLVLLLIGLASAYLPARRAASVDPLAALRQE
jgi:ABC-type antimicrobial peptide transport system permease subunit